MNGIPVQAEMFETGPGGVLRPIVNLPMPGHGPTPKNTMASTNLPDTGHSKARITDPPIAKRAATIAGMRSGSARVLLLAAYVGVDSGLTDEEAAERAGVSLLSEYATRISELIKYQMVVPTGYERPGRSGIPRRVCRITDYGRHTLGGLASGGARVEHNSDN